MMKSVDTSTPVVALACPHHSGLGVARSLGRLGVPTYCVEATRWSPDLFSRFCRRGFIWDVENAPAGDSVEFLAEVARRIGRHCILIPGTDGAATFIADHAPVLSQWYIFPDQNPQLVRSMCSKKEMH